MSPFCHFTDVITQNVKNSLTEVKLTFNYMDVKPNLTSVEHTCAPVKPSPQQSDEPSSTPDSSCASGVPPPTLCTALRLQETTDLLSVTVDQFAFSTALCKWNHSVTRHQYFEIHPCCCVNQFHSYLKLNRTPLFGKNSLYVSSPVDGHVWTASCFGLLQIKLLWTFIYRSLCGHVFISLGE